MMPEIKHIHHIAILVDNLDTSLTFWQDILGLKPSRVSDMPQESARIAIFPLGGSEIELVQPTTADSGLSRYLEKRGPGMHHLCLEVTDLYILLEQLKANGVQLINDEPKIGEGGKLYAFIHPKSSNGVLVELYQLPE
ncbi:MAG: methylmalonyl-CoA epimerase [Chloroflexi bacterium RBG_19FT_COMBO_47_9]|nr:MAG: methylmalonyl-CoA epimerase [Chloroflexi bacterium RBG_19FT_COMBO_47_9]